MRSLPGKCLALGFVVLLCIGGCPQPPVDQTGQDVPTPQQYMLLVDAEGEGIVTPAPGRYDAGTVVTLEAIPADGWRFDHWQGDIANDVNPLQTTIDADMVVTAVFVPIRFALSVSVQGQGAVSPEQGTYDPGATVSITAVPAEGWRFDHWEGDAEGTANPSQVTMDGDVTLVAVFVALPVELHVTVQGEGTVSPEQGAYPPNTEVVLTATPADGWRFDHWQGDVDSKANPLKVAIDSDTALVAVFVRIRYTLTVSVQGKGSVSPEQGTYDVGTVVPITASRASGWCFIGWQGAVNDPLNPSTTVQMDQNQSVVAVFGKCDPVGTWGFYKNSGDSDGELYVGLHTFYRDGAVDADFGGDLQVSVVYSVDDLSVSYIYTRTYPGPGTTYTFNYAIDVTSVSPDEMVGTYTHTAYGSTYTTQCSLRRRY